jgi:LacI family transcriptional regulator
LPKTIYDIAKAAGVSIATVSRVYNRSNSVKESTRKKIITIADEMGYYPQAYAQRLASKKKNSIMMMVPVMSNHFFTEILKGTQDILVDLNIELTIQNVNQEMGVFRQVEQILKRQWADGYLLVSLHLSDHELKKLKRFNVPLSLLDDDSPLYDSVGFDNVAGGYKATAYLLDKGHHNIVFLSGKLNAKPVKERLQGYKNALSEYQIPFLSERVILGNSMDRDGFTEKSGYEAMLKILHLNPLPDAVFCASDIKAIGALKAMKDHNITLPLVSYDNLSISEYIGLTTVHQPMYDMGYHATRHLIERIDNPNASICDYIHDPELIIRSSSEV